MQEISRKPTGDGVTTGVVVRVKPALNTPGLTARFLRLRVSAQ
jgi:hypothetical protein